MFKKSIIMGIAAVGAMSLVGTGFAGWVISRSVQEVATGNVKAYAVTDSTVDVEIAKSADNIIFGKPSNYSPSDVGKWLMPDNEVADEVLSTTFTITVSNFANTSQKAYLSYKLELPTIDAQYATVAISSTSHASQVTSQGPVYNLEQTQSNGTAVYTITVTYAWGEAFKPTNGSAGVNPYIYFNAKPYSEANATEATNKLTALKNALTVGEGDDASFTLVVVAGTAAIDTSDASVFDIA